MNKLICLIILLVRLHATRRHHHDSKIHARLSGRKWINYNKLLNRSEHKFNSELVQKKAELVQLLMAELVMLRNIELEYSEDQEG